MARLGALAALLVVTFALAAPGVALLERGSTGSARADGGEHAGNHAGATAGGNCTAPSSILMPLVNLNGSYAAHTQILVTYELELTAGGSGPITVHLPRVFASFPVSAGGAVTLSIAPNNLTNVTTSWTTPGTESTRSTLSGATVFDGSSSALLSSEFIAVVAEVTSYEGTSVSVRWDWTVTAPGGSATTSPWSVNTNDQNFPSDFHPAPFVNLLAPGNHESRTRAEAASRL